MDFIDLLCQCGFFRESSCPCHLRRGLLYLEVEYCEDVYVDDERRLAVSIQKDNPSDHVLVRIYWDIPSKSIRKMYYDSSYSMSTYYGHILTGGYCPEDYVMFVLPSFFDMTDDFLSELERTLRKRTKDIPKEARKRLRTLRKDMIERYDRWMIESDMIDESKLDYIDEQLIHHFGKIDYLAMFEKYGNADRLSTGLLDRSLLLFLEIDESKWKTIRNSSGFVLYHD